LQTTIEQIVSVVFPVALSLSILSVQSSLPFYPFPSFLALFSHPCIIPSLLSQPLGSLPCQYS